eukprot:gene3185-5918_t
METLESYRELFKQPSRSDISCHGDSVLCLDWDCDGDKLGSGSMDKTACVLKLTKDRLVKDIELRGHTGSIDFLSWHPTESTTLATASSDHFVKFWDVRAGARCTSSVPTKRPSICVRYDPEGKILALVNLEDTLMLIDTRTGNVLERKQFNYEVNEFAWDKSGKYFFLTNIHGNVEVYNFPELEPTDVHIKAHTSSCTCINFSPTFEYFATGSRDATISIFDADEFICIRGISDYGWPVKHIYLSHDGALLTAASEDDQLCIYHVKTGEQVTPQSSSVKPNPHAMAWHPKRILLAYQTPREGRIGLLGSV